MILYIGTYPVVVSKNEFVVNNIILPFFDKALDRRLQLAIFERFRAQHHESIRASWVRRDMVHVFEARTIQSMTSQPLHSSLAVSVWYINRLDLERH